MNAPNNMTNEAKYITSEKAKQLTRAYEHKYNYIYWEIVFDDGDYAEQIEPDKWIVIQHYGARTIFLKVEKDMTLTEYCVEVASETHGYKEN